MAVVLVPIVRAVVASAAFAVLFYDSQIDAGQTDTDGLLGSKMQGMGLVGGGLELEEGKGVDFS